MADAAGRAGVRQRQPGPVAVRGVADRLRRVPRLLASGVLAGVFLLPLLFMLGASLRPFGLPPPRGLELWPPTTTWANYATVFDLLPLGRYALNSLGFAAASAALTLLTGSWTGLTLARLPVRPRQTLIALLLAALLVPAMSVWLPRYLEYKWLGVLDTPWALLLPALLGGGPLAALVLYSACRGIPEELFEAARLDGCGPLRLWWSIALPLVRPALVAVGLLAFIQSWSNVLDPLLYINDPDLYTLPLGLQALQQMHPSRRGLQMAGAFLVTVPPVLIFLLAQRALPRGPAEPGGPG